MDSRQVTKKINSEIRPILKENGFNEFTRRTYWRYKPDRIDILNFQSFNSYKADGLGCTTFSFAVNLSTFMNFIPTKSKIKERNGLKKPEEYEGHFRYGLTKGIKQKEFPREDIWFVNTNGKYLDNVIADCKTQIEERAFCWYEQFESKENVLQILLNNQIDINGTFGFGNMDSPVRKKFIAYTALELGKTELAIEKLNNLKASYEEKYFDSENKYFSDLAKETAKEIDRLKTTYNTI